LNSTKCDKKGKLYFTEKCYLPIFPDIYKALVEEQIYRLKNHGGEDLPLSKPDALWTFKAERNIDSIELWLHSLSFLYPLLDEYQKSVSADIFDVTTSIIESFITYAKTSDNHYVKKGDHAICSRIIVLLRALYAFSDDWRIKQTVCDYVVSQTDILSSGELSHTGNHGIMQDLALLHAGALLDTGNSSNYINTALKRVREQINEAFDEEGVNNENSSWYFLFNYQLYKEICIICSNYRIESGYLKDIKETLIKAEDALGWMVLPDNWITLVGDH
jgi:hypothetical protein